jgi:DeoR/GlpR family transcriptional regulator of sugar metabolism
MEDEGGIGLPVAIPGPTIVAVLADRTDHALVTIGGEVNPLISAAVDSRALRQVLGLRPILLSLGICAIDADDGITAFQSEDEQMKRALLERSGSVGIAVLKEKLSASVPFQIDSSTVPRGVCVSSDHGTQVFM